MKRFLINEDDINRYKISKDIEFSDVHFDNKPFSFEDIELGLYNPNLYNMDTQNNQNDDINLHTECAKSITRFFK